MSLSRVLFLVLLLAGCSQESGQDPFEVLLAGGTVYNGRDENPVVTDIGISGDRIVEIGDLRGRDAGMRLDVTGLAVMPGIVDIHSHAIRDNPEGSGIYRWPDAENEIRQGVTTVIGGPDGGSPLPLEDDFRRLEESPAAVNFGTFVGHGSVRELVVGLDDRPATDEELQRMREEVGKAMQSGAFGLSSGLLYVPGSFAPAEEVIELARVAADYGGIYISHMRNESQGLLDSVEETIRIAEEALSLIHI